MDRIKQMQVFVQVVESGNFACAVEVFGQPRSTVSVMVQALEDRLGVQLLQRTKRVVSLTQEGLQFVATSRDLISAMAEGEGQFRHEPEQIAGRLRIDMPSRIARRFVIPHLHEFCAHYPGLTLDISATDHMIDPVSEGVGAVVRLAELSDSDLICRKIEELPILTCASALYVARFGVPERYDDLEHHVSVNYALRFL
ncbi:LysR family transcriptional regulator [Celeribacter sp.]|uniref:LysR family transcriptional regulator n=1 Tax=Celeribacter sp. TaxID=1890673 RepID=UPI003A8EA8FE